MKWREIVCETYTRFSSEHTTHFSRNLKFISSVHSTRATHSRATTTRNLRSSRDILYECTQGTNIGKIQCMTLYINMCVFVDCCLLFIARNQFHSLSNISSSSPAPLNTFFTSHLSSFCRANASCKRRAEQCF
jgi:hypothetical protein